MGILRQNLSAAIAKTFFIRSQQLLANPARVGIEELTKALAEQASQGGKLPKPGKRLASHEEGPLLRVEATASFFILGGEKIHTPHGDD